MRKLIEYLDETGFRKARIVVLVAATYLIVCIGIGIYWSIEPDAFNVEENAQTMLREKGRTGVRGAATTAALIRVGGTLLQKPGGYISNDIFPPGIWLDNITSWEFGALVQVRDLARALRRDISRSQSQSAEDEHLAVAEPQLHFDNDSWAMPASESEYRRGIKLLDRYLGRLADPAVQNAQFYARADNLRNWLADVETRLGSLSQRLGASVGENRSNTDLAGDSAAGQSTPTPSVIRVQTPWLELDDVFYEARGTAWALAHFLRAVEVDFAEVLEKKNAAVSLRQIIRELEATQETLWSPMVLNGSGFGMLANHSLVMASYLSRANAGLIQLRELLAQG